MPRRHRPAVARTSTPMDGRKSSGNCQIGQSKRRGNRRSARSKQPSTPMEGLKPRKNCQIGQSEGRGNHRAAGSKQATAEISPGCCVHCPAAAAAPARTQGRPKAEQDRPRRGAGGWERDKSPSSAPPPPPSTATPLSPPPASPLAWEGRRVLLPPPRRAGKP
ncbi:uncharacterized protein LOC119315888 [Triticum dicoccoides]|uniref:uncharacterized protein LOC119315888 n=1 Tax=Triticum dicoccoides TaxID=85692 RepID=UPI0018915C45|nr:uncharacterized protein LOC119315888 [Triticum dicoccoides]